MTRLGELTWPEAGRRAAAGVILVVPVGSTEQHGPHLPISTDTDVALALASVLAERRGDILVAPPVAYGSSGEHAGFPGTLSIGQEAVELLLVELGRSASGFFDHLLLVSAHGGNELPVRRAVERLQAESRDVLAWSSRSPGDAHAGLTETSIQLFLCGRLVRRDLAVAGNTRPIAELMPVLRERSVQAVSANGVLGDPRRANVALGAELFEFLANDLQAAVRAWRGEASPPLSGELVENASRTD